jgi:hypothetical protein
LSRASDRLALWLGSVAIMNPGDRIDLIRRLADDLSGSELPDDDIELMLRGFGFRAGGWDPSYEQSLRSYVIGALESGSDEALVELDEYRLGGGSRAQLDPADLPWAPGMYRLFMSHTHAHAALAGKIKTYFARWRIDAFVAHTTIEPTREWLRTIEAALGSCDALAALLTDDFVSSKWCDQEVGYCVARHIPMVPVKFENDPHGFIGKYQAAVPTSRDDAWVADAIFRALARNNTAMHAMATPVVHRYATSTSFDGARSNFELLQGVPDEAWTPDLVEVVERAPATNNQIEHAGVAEGPFQGPMPEAAAEMLRPIRQRLGMDEPPPVSPADDDIPF